MYVYKLKQKEMKKILTIIAAASIFAACSSDKDLDTKTDVVLTDTSGMYKSNYSTDVSADAIEKEEAVTPKVIRETRVVYVDRTPKARRQTVREANPVITEPVANIPQTNTGVEDKASQSSTGTVSNKGNDNGNTSTSAEPEKKEKEGWSNSTKGAVIGGVGGAVTGAILSKKKVKGAIIGGVIGAAGGYILGRKKDKAEDANNVPQYTSY